MKLIFSYLGKVLAIFFLTLPFSFRAQSIPGFLVNQQESVSTSHQSNRGNLFDDYLIDVSVDDDDITDQDHDDFSIAQSVFTDITFGIHACSYYYFDQVRASKFFIHLRPLLFILLCVFRI